MAFGSGITSLSATQYIVVGLIFLILLGFVAYPASSRQIRVPKGLQSPPSPPGELFFNGHSHIWNGNATSNPSQSQLVKWAREYGEIYRIRMGTENWVILSSPEAIKVECQTQMNMDEIILTRGTLGSF